MQKGKNIITAAELIKVLGSIVEQREMFLLRFRDIDRTDCVKLADDFKIFDVYNKNELTEHQVLMLLEDRNQTKTATELREILGEMRKGESKNITFVEFACSFFGKNFEDLDNFVDEEAKEIAKKEAEKQEELVQLVEEETKRKREEDETKAAAKAAELEAESKLTGVAGMAAFFKRQAENTIHSKTNEQMIKEDAVLRKQMREEKDKLRKAIEEACRVKSAQDVIKEVEEAAAKREQEEQYAIMKKSEEEKIIRAAKSAANNAKWSGGSLPSPNKPLSTISKNNLLPLRS